MTNTVKTDICVIGAGSGGLSVAAGAVQMGAKVVLIEGHEMGGDCLHYGCVPSKALIAASHAADRVRHAGRYGVNCQAPKIDFLKVQDHVHGVIAAIAPNDSVERFQDLGVDVIHGMARFTGPRELEAGGRRIRARRFVIATGSSSAVPPIPGLDQVPYLTNKTIFDLDEHPEHLIVIGGGPIGTEIAQAHRRLGARVTLLEGRSILGKDDPEAVEVVRSQLIGDGIDLWEDAMIQGVESHGNGIAVMVERDGGTVRIDGSHLMVAAGRHPNVYGLHLKTAGIRYSSKGIDVDARLRTSNKKVFAVGDVTGGYMFTHMAAYHAGIVIRNALFLIPAKVKYTAVPWVTYVDPQLAHVGLNEIEARERFGDDIRVLKHPFTENDRAQAERETKGLIKVIVHRNGRILGTTIVGHHAGELIFTWVLAIQEGLKIGAIANLIAPYPTLSEISKQVAGTYYTPTLFSERTHKLVGALQHLG